MDMRPAQPDAPSASRRNPCRLTSSACGARAFFAAPRASWRRPRQLVRALLGCAGSRVDRPVSVRYTGTTERLPQFPSSPPVVPWPSLARTLRIRASPARRVPVWALAIIPNDTPRPECGANG